MGISAAFIMPHPPLAVEGVGGNTDKESIPATMEAFHSIAKEIAALKPDTIIVTSPHSIIYSDYFHISPGESARGDFSAFGSGVAMEASYDTEFVANLSRFCADALFDAGTEGERDPGLDHGTMVPLYFVNQYYTDYDLVRISLSGMSLRDHFSFGKFIKKVADNSEKNIVFIASGDLSHYQNENGPYGYRPEGPLYDEKLMDTLGSGNLEGLLDFDSHLLSRAGECGHRSFCILAGALYDEKIKVRILSHENTFGVGYGLAAIDVISTFKKRYASNGGTGFKAALESAMDAKKRAWEEAMLLELERYYAGGTHRFTAKMEAAIMEYQEKDTYVLLARKAIDALILGEELPDADSEDLPEEMRNTRAGAFVSIHKNGALRGCIGTILATKKSLSAEIVANAVSASTQDPRFPAITQEELPLLEINVDVLSEPEPVPGPEALDAKKYGIIVQNDGRLGVLLPDLEGVETVEEQIAIAKRKAGISFGEPVDIMRFTVERHI